VEKYSSGMLDILQKQTDFYRQLLSLANEKKPVLIKGNIIRLEAITKEEESLIIKVGRLEEQRQALHKALAGHFAVAPEELSISELISRVNEPSKTKLTKIFAEINVIIGQIVEVNHTNNELINSSLEFVNFSLNLLTSHSTTPSYKEDEQQKKQSTAKIFDRSV
jgi:flagellar biosynthesis/type III secretory pathway chaperone